MNLHLMIPHDTSENIFQFLLMFLKRKQIYQNIFFSTATMRYNILLLFLCWHYIPTII